MDKNLVKIIKEQEKIDFKRKFNELYKKPKGLFIVTIFSFFINWIVLLLCRVILKQDFNVIDVITPTSIDDERYEKKNLKMLDFLILFIIGLAIFIVFCISVNYIN